MSQSNSPIAVKYLRTSWFIGVESVPTHFNLVFAALVAKVFKCAVSSVSSNSFLLASRIKWNLLHGHDAWLTLICENRQFFIRYRSKAVWCNFKKRKCNQYSEGFFPSVFPETINEKLYSPPPFFMINK